MSALDKQEGGGHYKGKAIQPVQYIHANGLGFCEGNVVKYITRWREKGGKADLLKVIHYVELLMELEGLAASSAQVVNMALNPVFHMPLAGPYGAGEPAADIDDESDRQKAVEQNGNDGAVYDDPWYGAPEWAKYKAQDEDGEWRWYSHLPEAGEERWHDVAIPGRAAHAHEDHPNPNWRDTLISR